jgi:hypothetical protein
MMSKRMQIYYNAVFGAIGGLLGWLIVGFFDVTRFKNIWLESVLIGAGVGLFIGALAGAVEGAVIKRSLPRALAGAITGALAGMVSGMIGLVVGEAAFKIIGGEFVGRGVGWLALGLLLGVGQGAVAKSSRRTSYGAVGGTLAGLVGGLIYEVMTQLFKSPDDTVQMVFGGLGLILIGACLGSIIPMTIMGLARGSLRVLAGRREGMEVAIVDAVCLGSYDGCEVYLPGDPSVDKRHARIYRTTGGFTVQDLGSAGGTYVGNVRLLPGQERPLQKGDQIRVGNTLLQLE